jgi:hypothetical protein
MFNMNMLIVALFQIGYSRCHHCTLAFVQTAAGQVLADDELQRIGISRGLIKQTL